MPVLTSRCRPERIASPGLNGQTAMKVLRKHNSKQEAVRDEIETLLPSLMERFGSSVSEVKHEWRGDDLGFSFRAGGFNLRGTVSVSDTDLLVDLRLPMAARLFEGKIRSAVENELDRLLPSSP